MKIIEIKELDNGGHNNQEIMGADPSTFPIPEGWAVIPNDMVCENFPFGEVTVAEVDGVMTVTEWVAGEMPEPEPEPQPEPELSVWDKLDAAYQEGVNSAYDE